MAAPWYLPPMFEGVTAAVIGFIFLCIAFPHLVKKRQPFYLALWVVIGVILLQSIREMLQKVEILPNIILGFCGLLLIVAVLALVVATGGFSIGELKSNLIEVVRRGEEEKEYIIPIGGGAGGEQPRRRRDADDEDRPRERIELEMPPDRPGE